jgi:hypothetical protein
MGTRDSEDRLPGPHPTPAQQRTRAPKAAPDIPQLILLQCNLRTIISIITPQSRHSPQEWNPRSMLRLSLLLLNALVAETAHAGEGLFSRVYTTETVPKGHFEIEQTFRDRTLRAYGKYNALDSKTEFEYGVTDQFQVAAYLNTGWISGKGFPEDNDAQGDTPRGMDRERFGVESVTLEFVYRWLSPITDGIGIAFYNEPEYMFMDMHNGDTYYNSFADEFRVLVQKNWFDDQLIFVYNLVAEFEYYRYTNTFRVAQPFQGELDFNNELGLTYRFAPNFYGGLEARNHNEIGNFWSHDHTIVWAGPAVHYAGQKYWGTLGVLRQVYGVPNGTDSNGSFQGDNLFLHSHEKWEITAKIGLPF